MSAIPLSILITTYNEEHNIGACLQSLDGFDNIIVIDSNSTDRTQEIAKKYGAEVISFTWNGEYPKKRQWVLGNVKTKYEYVFWLDADERVTPEFKHALDNLDFSAAGYFVKSSYIWNKSILKHGLKNKKLAVMHRDKFIFPVVDDLDVAGMGEIEGHYQPVLKPQYKHEKIDEVKTPYLHDAYQDLSKWMERHKNYAHWEAIMRAREAYPTEDDHKRQLLKALFNAIPLRHWVVFLHSYILKFGFLDGLNDYDFACSRSYYYKLVRKSQDRLASQ